MIYNNKQKTILLIEDDKNFLEITKKILVYEGYDVVGICDPAMVMEMKDFDTYGLIITDLVMPQVDGIEVLKHIKTISADQTVIILTGNATIETAVEAMRLGAYTYIEKPVSPDELARKIRGVLSIGGCPSKADHNTPASHTFIGNSHQILYVKKSIPIIAKVDSPIVITGESGTGKEMIANQIHLESPYRKGAFVAVNCAAIPENLIESELFGFEKGSFTGAYKEKKGKFELAAGGTLFLDEISELSPFAQSKLLRALQEKKIDRIGGESPIKVDFRLVCATNKDLRKLVGEGSFREDLYYRINVIRIELPPLRERQSDLPLLIDYFSNYFSQKFNKPDLTFNDNILDILTNYKWPGNIRELKNVMERLYIFANNGSPIALNDLPKELLDGKNDESGSPLFADNESYGNYKDTKYVFEKRYLLRMLEKNQWNITNTAKEIGLSRRNLHEKIKQFNLKYNGDGSND